MKLVAFLLLALVGTAEAQIKLPSYNALCTYDKEYCRKAGKLIEGNKVIYTRPKPEVLAYYAKLRSTIIAVANQYGIDAVTLALTPIAENSMNVKKEDEYQTFLVANGMSSEIRIGDKALTFGPGQISVYAADDAEDIAAAIERRPRRSKRQITQQLLTPEGSLRYAAAIIKLGQETYRKMGMDISRRPEILSTLYNIGKMQQRANNTAKMRVEPRPNYFGFFVGYNYWSVKKALGLPSLLTPPEAAAPAPTSAPVEDKKSSKRPPSESEKVVVPSDEELTIEKSILKPTRTYTNPSLCFADGSNFPGTLTTREMSGAYQIVGHGMDCNGTPWSMIKVSDQVGWLSDAALKEKTIVQKFGADDYKDQASCEKQVTVTCIARVQAIKDQNNMKLIGNKSESIWELQPIGRFKTTGITNLTTEEADSLLHESRVSQVKEADLRRKLNDVRDCLKLKRCFVNSAANILRENPTPEQLQVFSKTVSFLDLSNFKEGKRPYNICDTSGTEGIEHLFDGFGVQPLFDIRTEVNVMCEAQRTCQINLRNTNLRGKDKDSLESYCKAVSETPRQYLKQLADEVKDSLTTPGSTPGDIFSKKLVSELGNDSCVTAIALPESNKLYDVINTSARSKLITSTIVTDSAKMVLQLKNRCGK